jgi:hypothetical protein
MSINRRSMRKSVISSKFSMLPVDKVILNQESNEDRDSGEE